MLIQLGTDNSPLSDCYFQRVVFIHSPESGTGNEARKNWSIHSDKIADQGVTILDELFRIKSRRNPGYRHKGRCRL